MQTHLALDYIKINLFTGIQVFTLDYGRAFDCLDHNVIIRKFVSCNFLSSFIHPSYSLLSRYQRPLGKGEKPCKGYGRLFFQQHGVGDQHALERA